MTQTFETDPVALTQTLVRCRSVTPADMGALGEIQARLESAGFAVTRIKRGEVDNLFARWGVAGNGPVFGFNGHTDVVPPGQETAWTHPPFDGAIVEGTLFGRGAVDMKSGVAAFVTAAMDFVRETPPEGGVVITITGDEEGPARDGTAAILDWMADAGERMDVCLVGEPTCPNTMGEMMKIGRRGSMTVYLKATGKQGHAAYPHRANNPLLPLVRLLDDLASEPLDQGTAFFEPSTLTITTIDVGNPANNVIPEKAVATVNIRFNDAHSSDSLRAQIDKKIAAAVAASGVKIEADYSVSGQSFVTEKGAFSDLVSAAVAGELGIEPELSTSGGTSDARFIRAHCPVVEFGLVGNTMHQIDERVPISQIVQLKAIYKRILSSYFFGDSDPAAKV